MCRSSGKKMSCVGQEFQADALFFLLKQHKIGVFNNVYSLKDVYSLKFLYYNVLVMINFLDFFLRALFFNQALLITFSLLCFKNLSGFVTF